MQSKVSLKFTLFRWSWDSLGQQTLVFVALSLPTYPYLAGCVCPAQGRATLITKRATVRLFPLPEGHTITNCEILQKIDQSKKTENNFVINNQPYQHVHPCISQLTWARGGVHLGPFTSQAHCHIERQKIIHSCAI